MYQIEEPTYFYYLAIIPTIIVVFLLTFWWKKRAQKQFTDALLLEKLAPNASTFKSVLKLIFLAIGVGMILTRKKEPEDIQKTKRLSKKSK